MAQGLMFAPVLGATVIMLIGGMLGITESETSYTWRLDLDVGKVMPAPGESMMKAAVVETEEGDPAVMQEAVMDILLSTVTHPDGSWKKTTKVQGLHRRNQAESCSTLSCTDPRRNNRGIPVSSSSNDDLIDEYEDEELLKGEVLDCGKPVNFTYYDHLVGIQNRASHPTMPEPDVTSTFKTLLAPSSKRASKNKEVSIDAIERRLKKAKREKPKSVELYNQIGNFWRIKGDTQKSIECFRRALAVSPNSADILLNLARVLFNLQYLDDAIFLTRRSLEVQPPDQNAWLQHFQLGEILKAYCHYQEAALHLRHVLELKPNYAPAIAALQDMESIPDSSVHMYTIVIIVLLVLGVLVWIVVTLDVTSQDPDGNGDSGGASSGKKLSFKSMRFQMRHNKR